MARSRLFISNSSMMTFFKKILFFLSPLPLIFVIPIIVLILGREYISIDQALGMQMKYSDSLFGFVYNDQSFISYKQALVEYKNPEIIALGTSRVMQLRKEFFVRQDMFINAGGGAENLNDVSQFIQNLSATSSVKVILLGLDQDMFTSKENTFSYLPRKTNFFDVWKHILFTNIRKIYTDYARKKYSLQELLRKQSGHSIGIAAIIRGDGFRSDGSYRYGRIIEETDMAPRVQQQIQDTLSAMKYGRYASFMTSGHEENNIETLRSILKLAKSKHIEVVGFSPPYPSKLYAHMKDSKEYSGTINLLPKHIKQVFNNAGFTFFDFSDITLFNAPDTEFIDNIHASDKMHIRMLIVLTENIPSLKKYIDVKILRTMLDSSKENILTF